MNLEFFIAKKIYFSPSQGKNISRPIIRLATAGIALSLAVMIIAIGVVVGFKKEVRNKLIGFSSHIQVSASFSNLTYETHPIQFDSSLVQLINSNPYVTHTQPFATQPGIIKLNEEFQGVVLKGVDASYNWSFFRNNLVEGTLPCITDTAFTSQTLISKKQSEMLRLNVGDKFHVYFIIDGKVRVRPLEVSGIYSTGFSDYDKIFIIGDIHHIRKLNQWEESECSGLEIELSDFEQLDAAMDDLYPLVGNQHDTKGSFYMLKSIQETNPQIFSWLDLLDTNVVIILLLMMLVAGFTMISGLLILILDRTNMIGVLKALGAANSSIQKTFLYIAIFLVGKGMLLGNLLGLFLCLIQTHYGIIKLDPDVYYVTAVPIELSVSNLLLTNVVVLLISTAILKLSTSIITSISPIKSIRFE